MLQTECGLQCELISKDQSLCAILVHPYALLGGSMNDYVIQTVKSFLSSKLISTMTINLTPGYGYNAIKHDVQKLLEITDLMKTKYGNV